jgi:hypothetical protein
MTWCTFIWLYTQRISSVFIFGLIWQSRLLGSVLTLNVSVLLIWFRLWGHPISHVVMLDLVLDCGTWRSLRSEEWGSTGSRFRNEVPYRWNIMNGWDQYKVEHSALHLWRSDRLFWQCCLCSSKEDDEVSNNQNSEFSQKQSHDENLDPARQNGTENRGYCWM